MNNKELLTLYNKDQRNLKNWLSKNLSSEDFLDINKKMRRKVSSLINSRQLNSGKEYFYAGIIFQHGFNSYSSKLAEKYARKAVNMGYKKGKWLIAASIDRRLQLEGKPQKFGTQAENMFAKKLKMYRLDGSVSDEERKEYGLPGLKKLEERLK